MAADEPNLVTLMGFENEMQAQFPFEQLEGAGIPAQIENLSGETISEAPEPEALPRMGGPVVLRVPEEQAKRAAEILEENMDDRMGEGGNPAVL